MGWDWVLYAFGRDEDCRGSRRNLGFKNRGVQDICPSRLPKRSCLVKAPAGALFSLFRFSARFLHLWRNHEKRSKSRKHFHIKTRGRATAEPRAPSRSCAPCAEAAAVLLTVWGPRRGREGAHMGPTLGAETSFLVTQPKWGSLTLITFPHPHRLMPSLPVRAS